MSKDLPEVRFKLSEPDHDDLKKLAQRKKTTIAALARKFVIQGLHNELLEDSVDNVLSKIRRVVKQELKPVSERLGDLLCKVAIDSKTGLILNFLNLKEISDHDVDELKHRARLKAIADLKIPVDEIMKEDEDGKR